MPNPDCDDFEDQQSGISRAKLKPTSNPEQAFSDMQLTSGLHEFERV